jgi:hypothetical protein
MAVFPASRCTLWVGLIELETILNLAIGDRRIVCPPYSIAQAAWQLAPCHIFDTVVVLGDYRRFPSRFEFVTAKRFQTIVVTLVSIDETRPRLLRKLIVLRKVIRDSEPRCFGTYEDVGAGANRRRIDQRA